MKKVCLQVSIISAIINLQPAAAQVNGDVFNSPTHTGNNTVYAFQADASAGITGLNGNAGGAKVSLDNVQIAKGATTGSATNAPNHQGNLNVYSTGDVTARSIRIDNGAKTGNLENTTNRRGDVTVIAGGATGSISLLSRSASTTGSVTVDSIHVCQGAKAKNIKNSGRATGNSTVVGGDVAVNSVIIGC